MGLGSAEPLANEWDSAQFAYMDSLSTRFNRIGAAALALLWYSARPASLFALPGVVEDAATWQQWFAMMPDWLWGLGLFLFGVWVASAWYPVVSAALHPQWPDFEVLDKRDRFQLWEAACFWVNQVAKLPLRGAAWRQFKQFEGAIKARTLSVIREDLRETIYDAYDEKRGRRTKANPKWTVKRDALVEYAQSVDSKPPFLFPKERI